MRYPDDFSKPYELTIDGARVDLTRGGTTTLPDYGAGARSRALARGWAALADDEHPALAHPALALAAHERASVRRSATLCFAHVWQRFWRINPPDLRFAHTIHDPRTWRFGVVLNCHSDYAQLPERVVATEDFSTRLKVRIPQGWNAEVFRKGLAFFERGGSYGRLVLWHNPAREEVSVLTIERASTILANGFHFATRIVSTNEGSFA